MAVDNEARSSRMLWVAIGGAAPIGVAAALVSLRDHMLNANVALVLVLVVVLAAVGGGRSAGAVAAVSAALSFNFFHTMPYLTLEINSRDDVETTLLLLAVGLAVGQLASYRRHPSRSGESPSRRDPPHPSCRHRRRTGPAHVGGHDHGRPGRADRVAAAP